MARYCPNCSAELKNKGAECWNCGAALFSDGGWRPTDKPVGTFEPRRVPHESLAKAAPDPLPPPALRRESLRRPLGFGTRLVVVGVPYLVASTVLAHASIEARIFTYFPFWLLLWVAVWWVWRYRLMTLQGPRYLWNVLGIPLLAGFFCNVAYFFFPLIFALGL